MTVDRPKVELALIPWTLRMSYLVVQVYFYLNFFERIVSYFKIQ